MLKSDVIIIDNRTAHHEQTFSVSGGGVKQQGYVSYTSFSNLTSKWYWRVSVNGGGSRYSGTPYCNANYAEVSNWSTLLVGHYIDAVMKAWADAGGIVSGPNYPPDETYVAEADYTVKATHLIVVASAF